VTSYVTRIVTLYFRGERISKKGVKKKEGDEVQRTLKENKLKELNEIKF